MAEYFWDKVRERAYFKHLDKINNNLPDNPFADWVDAEREQKIEESIEIEAYLHFLSNGDYPLFNWLIAKNEIMQRLQFLAFYLHESNMNRSPMENWVDAQNLYLANF